MISDKKQFIYVHVNKTGGTSVQKILHVHCRKAAKHHHAQSLNDMRLYGTDYFRFTTVRNPYDRWVSNYHFNIRRNHKTAKNKSFKEYLFDVIDESKKESREFPDLWYNSAWNWISDDNDVLLVDYVMRFENLEADWKIVSKKLGVEDTLPKTNASSHDHYSKYYDDETYDLVTRHCAKDLEYLGYTFESE